MSAVMHEELQEKAFRLMEALSGVDEELLARSEEDGHSADHRREHRRRVFMWRYGKYLAACFVFLVLGVSAYSVSRLSLDVGKKQNSTGNAGGAADYSLMENYELPGNNGAAQLSPEEALSSMESEEENVTADTTENEAEAPAISPEEGAQRENTSDGAHTSNSAIDKSIEAAMDTALTLEAARDLSVVGEYIPKTLPEGYRFFNGVLLREQEGGGYDIQLFFRNDGDTDASDIVLRITDCCAAKKTEGNASVQEQIDLIWPERRGERTFVTAEDLTAEIFRTSDTVAIIYDSGVVVQYTGEGTPEEIYEMFLTVP